MKKTLAPALIAFNAAVMLAVALQMGGCSGSMQARSVDVKEAMLVNPDILRKKIGGDDALYSYYNPKADIRKYTKIMLDPVIVKKDGKLTREALANYQTLANNAYVYLTQELGDNYPIVTSPEPGVMRVQMAIIDADSSKSASNTTSTFLPIGIVLSAAKYVATGKEIGVGEITGEMKITDAVSGELLVAALDRRVGGKELSKLQDSWYNADDALHYWAKRLSYVLCAMRGENCVKP